MYEDSSDIFDPEQELLGADGSLENDSDSAANHSLRTAPVFTGDAFNVLGPNILPQRALYGHLISQHVPNFPGQGKSRKVYINTNSPFSALVCGVQVSGT